MMTNSKKPLKHITALVACFATKACTFIHIQNGETSIHRTFGHTQIVVAPDSTKATIVKTIGLGITTGQHSQTIGILKEKLFILPRDSECMAIISPQNNYDIESIATATPSIKDQITQLCTEHRGE